MKKLAAVSTFIMILIAGCSVNSSNNSNNNVSYGISITAVQPTAWEYTDDYLEFVVDLGAPNETSGNIIVYFDVSGTALARDDIDGNPYLEYGYVEIPSGSQSASIIIDGITGDGDIDETQTVVVTITGCSSADLPIGSQSSATAVIMDGDGEVVRDIDGNRYNTVKIGAQTWMVQNLKTTRFRNGNTIEECWCYNGDYSLWDYYGNLYTWYVVMDVRGLTPVGWHVPTKDDWRQLIDYLGGEGSAGGKLKATQKWDSPNTGATNESGFTAYPGGFRRIGGTYDDSGISGSFWSSSEQGYENNALEYFLTNRGPFIFETGFKKGMGISVRCIKD